MFMLLIREGEDNSAMDKVHAYSRKQRSPFLHRFFYDFYRSLKREKKCKATAIQNVLFYSFRLRNKVLKGM